MRAVWCTRGVPANTKPSKRRTPIRKRPGEQPAGPSASQPLLGPAELRAAIDRLESILAPLIARLGIEDAWLAATPASLANLGPINYFAAKMRHRGDMFARLVRADAHLFGAFLDGSLRRSVVLYDLADDDLAQAMADPCDEPVLVVEPREYPPSARAILDTGILGHHGGAVIAGERTPAGTVVHAITPDSVTRLGTFLELAEAGVAVLLPLQAPGDVTSSR